MVVSCHWAIALGVVLAVVSGCGEETSHKQGTPAPKSSLSGASPASGTNQVAVNVNFLAAEAGYRAVTGSEHIVGQDASKSEITGTLARPAYPEPPARECGDPERLIHYFCRCWKDEAYDRMYGALDRAFRLDTSFAQFKRRIHADAAFNGGLRDERLLQQAENLGSQITWVMQLVFQNRRAEPRTVKATVKKTIKGYRLIDSGLVPIDLEGL